MFSKLFTDNALLTSPFKRRWDRIFRIIHSFVKSYVVLIWLSETVDHKVMIGQCLFNRRFDMTYRWRACCLGMLSEKDRRKYISECPQSSPPYYVSM